MKKLILLPFVCLLSVPTFAGEPTSISENKKETSVFNLSQSDLKVLLADVFKWMERSIMEEIFSLLPTALVSVVLGLIQMLLLEKIFPEKWKWTLPVDLLL